MLAGALALPLSAPVPEEYAKTFDAKQPSLYGQNQVATGPYMIENNASGKAIGYEAGRSIHLVRNPNWDKSTDYKPAYLDEIDMPQGNDDTTVASRRVVDGSDMLTGDFSPPPAVLATVVKNQKDQLALFPGGSVRYVNMNNTIKPFDNINIRKAVVAGFDRNAHAPRARRRARRRHPDAHDPAGAARLRGGRWPEGPGSGLHVAPGG